jgi:hypothetical protein
LLRIKKEARLNTPLNRIALAISLLFSTPAAFAFEVDTGDSDLKFRIDTTVKYSTAARLRVRRAELSNTPPLTVNQDDGDNNFSRGIVSNRLDVFSEADLEYKDIGARLSGAGWYDAVYNRNTENISSTGNHVPSSDFPDETRKIMGRKAEVLDAFVFGRFNLDGHSGNVRAGRHTLLWGESLFFASNAIAGGQAPVDLVKLLSVPNSQTKEIARPTGKVSGQIKVSDAVSLGGYVGYEWEKTRLMPVGAYLSTSDSLGPGAERIMAGPFARFTREADIEASNTGQGGLQLRLRADDLDTDFGFYAIRYHAMTPSNIYTVLNGAPPALVPSSYRWAYHEGIRAFGMSAAKTVDAWSLSGEVSIRHNAPLNSVGQTILPTIGVNTTFDNHDNPGYAIGETAHVQMSWLASLGPSPLFQEAAFLGEIAWNRRLKVTSNPEMLNPLADRDATALRMVFSPTYRQALDGLDLSVPLGMGYGWGASSAVGPGFAVDKGGDFNIGLQGTYLGTYFIGLTYVKYLGPIGPTLDAQSRAQFTQALRDRDFMSLSLRTTF